MPSPITVEVKGLTLAINDLRGRSKGMGEEIGRMTRGLSNDLHAEYVANLSGAVPSTAERLLPVGVRTGLLRSSAKAVIINRYSFREENDAPYAGYIEFGTSKMVARAPMRNAKEKLEEEVPGKMDEVILRGWPVR